MASLVFILLINLESIPSLHHIFQYTHCLITTPAQQLAKMNRPRTWSQVRRDDNKADRRRAMEKAADKQRAKEERRRAADSRQSQSHQRRSEQQTIHDSYYDRYGNTQKSRTEIREIYDGARRVTVEITTDEFTITSPTYGSSLPYRNPRPEPQPTSAYTGEKLHSPTYHAKNRQPLGEDWDTHGYQSTSSKAPSKPQSPSQQTPRPHHERGRRRTRVPDTSLPRPKTAPSVIEPACISEPDTEVDHPRDEVEFLPTPAASESTGTRPSSTRHKRDPSRHQRPVTHAYNTERRSSPHYHWNTATQSSQAAQSGRGKKTATHTQHSNWPSVAPLGKSTNTTQLSNEPSNEPVRPLGRSARSTEAQQPSPLTDQDRRSKYPTTREEFPRKSPSMVNGPQTSPVKAHGGAQPEPTQSKTLTVTTKPKIGSTGKTRETQHTTEPGKTTERTQTAKPPTPAPRRRRRGLGESYGYDPRDKL